MPEVVEIVLRVRAGARLTAGFVGWEVEHVDDLTVVRRVDATPTQVHDALVEVGELGLEIEAFRRLEPA